MKLDEFNFHLPEEFIAQAPIADRDASRMMVVDRSTEGTSHETFNHLPSFLGEGDTLVVNDSKVIPARLFARKATGGKIEILLLREEARSGSRSPSWQVLLRPAKGISESLLLELPGGGKARIMEKISDKKWLLSFETDLHFADYLDRYGDVPLPPYIKRPEGASVLDRERYQTVYARSPGSVAAPTAGLHFTPRLLAALEDRGVQVARITLHVGHGTFQPVLVEEIADHRVDEEYYEITPEAAAAINSARRVIAVGTTSVRTLESAADAKGFILPATGITDLYIYPGYRFKRVNAIITNFHLPRSSLFLLVCAFSGRTRMIDAYRSLIRHCF